MADLCSRLQAHSLGPHMHPDLQDDILAAVIEITSLHSVCEFQMRKTDAAEAEIERLHEALKGATVVTNTASGEIRRLTAALQELLDRGEAIALWHQNWDLPFAEENEWCGDAKLWRDARFNARAALTGNREGEKG